MSAVYERKPFQIAADRQQEQTMSDNQVGVDLSVVVPVYNEVQCLPALQQQLKEVMESIGRPYEIIVVDDGSTDGSYDTLCELHARNKNLKVIRFRRNFGQTAAFAAGFDYAHGNVVITIDADLQNDPHDIPTLLAKMQEGYDVVSGWRKERKDPLLTRRLPSMAANWLISTVTGVKLHDYGCSLKVYDRQVVKSLRLYGEMHRFLPALASWMGVEVAEVPVNHRTRVFGRSKYGLSRTIRVLLDLLTVRFLLSFSARPMQLFGTFGIMSFAVGALLGLYLSILKIVYHRSIGERPLLLLAVLLMVIGIQFVTMGLLAELMVRTYHESQGKRTYVIREILE